MTDPYAWATESQKIASDFVYTAPQAPTPISQDYTAQAMATCQSQVALGGYRLAILLDSIFSASSTDSGAFARAVVASIRSSRREAASTTEEGDRRPSLRGAAA